MSTTRQELARVIERVLVVLVSRTAIVLSLAITGALCIYCEFFRPDRFPGPDKDYLLEFTYGAYLGVGFGMFILQIAAGLSEEKPVQSAVLFVLAFHLPLMAGSAAAAYLYLAI